ncbi:MAG: hypothetical protein ACFE85_06415 [Candidatus Hodarchaeota archaeon]
MLNKKVFVIISVFVGIIFVSILLNGNAYPSYTQPHEDCHTVPGGYSIGTNISTSNSINASAVITFNITATGSNLFIQAPSDAKENNQFTILPTTTRILDNSANDSNPNLNAMTVTFNITAPSEDGYYTILILAGDNSVSGSPPPFDYIEIDFSIGGVLPPAPRIEIFNHFEIYIGLTALLLLSIGTVLVLINENKFVKIHGIFAGSSWILTLINVISLVIFNPSIWTSFSFGIHWSHIILGGVGLLTGLFSMLFGIAAERKYAKLTGYITLVCWWAAFFSGFLMVPLF